MKYHVFFSFEKGEETTFLLLEVSLQSSHAPGPVVPDVSVGRTLQPLPLGNLNDFVGDPLLGGSSHVNVVTVAGRVVAGDGLPEVGAGVRTCNIGFQNIFFGYVRNPVR